MPYYFYNPVTLDGYIFANPFIDIEIGPPQFVGSVTGSLQLASNLTVSYEVNQPCTVYYIVVAEGSTVPTPGQIKTGNNYPGGTSLGSGSKVYASGRDSYVVNGLGPSGSTLVIYTTAESGETGLQTPDLIDALTVKLDYTQTAGFQSLFD